MLGLKVQCLVFRAIFWHENPKTAKFKTDRVGADLMRIISEESKKPNGFAIGSRTICFALFLHVSIFKENFYLQNNLVSAETYGSKRNVVL